MHPREPNHVKHSNYAAAGLPPAGKPISAKVMALGEVGLLGEIREVMAEVKRVKEAKRLGFAFPVTSKEVKYIGEAIKKLLK